MGEAAVTATPPPRPEKRGEPGLHPMQSEDTE